MSPALDVNVSVFADFELPRDLTDDLLADLVGFALQAESATGAWEVNLAFVGEDEITRLHDQFMGLPEPTDILTFASEGEGRRGGDIAICVPVAAENANEHGISLERELCFLVAHGVLHLLDHDDRTDEMRGAMLSRQDQILDEWGRVSR